MNSYQVLWAIVGMHIGFDQLEESLYMAMLEKGSPWESIVELQWIARG
jgi:hypothetical protein